jgi:hypothetical protein
MYHGSDRVKVWKKQLAERKEAAKEPARLAAETAPPIALAPSSSETGTFLLSK